MIIELFFVNKIETDIWLIENFMNCKFWLLNGNDEVYYDYYLCPGKLRMHEWDMELLLIMMDYHKINSSFEFKSHLGIKYPEF